MFDSDANVRHIVNICNVWQLIIIKHATFIKYTQRIDYLCQ